MQGVKLMIKSPLSFTMLKVQCMLQSQLYHVAFWVYVCNLKLFSMSALSHPSTIHAARSHSNLCCNHKASIPTMAFQQQRVRKGPSLLAVPAVFMRSYIYSNTINII